jgi:arylamine N-acetyltransferase
MREIPDIYQRYLGLIGIQNTPYGIGGLEEIVHNHLCAVPFENVLKLLLYKRGSAGRPFTLTEFLDGVEHQDLGGTCHSNNPFLANLLNVFGYNVSLLGADMGELNVHTCIRVLMGSVQYHVDVGYAAPFRKPIRFDKLPHEIKHGDYLYVVQRQSFSFRYFGIFSRKKVFSILVFCIAH